MGRRWTAAWTLRSVLLLVAISGRSAQQCADCGQKCFTTKVAPPTPGSRAWHPGRCRFQRLPQGTGKGGWGYLGGGKAGGRQLGVGLRHYLCGCACMAAEWESIMVSSSLSFG
jgi:hypothetical protein